jgi:uncharacterized protein YcbK (DUF882 family)
VCDHIECSGIDHHRRKFLAGAAGLVTTGLLAPLRSQALVDSTRQLDLYHTHTGDRLSVVYYADGDYRRDGLEKINLFLRDFRTEDRHPIDPQVLDILYDLRAMTVGSGEYQIISAYRSPKTNAMLRKKSSGVARKSLHMQGMAIDVRLPGCDTARLRDAAIDLKRGGVGYYASSNFVHVDTGRVRRW